MTAEKYGSGSSQFWKQSSGHKQRGVNHSFGFVCFGKTVSRAQEFKLGILMG